MQCVFEPLEVHRKCIIAYLFSLILRSSEASLSLHSTSLKLWHLRISAIMFLLFLQQRGPGHSMGLSVEKRQSSERGSMNHASRLEDMHRPIIWDSSAPTSLQCPPRKVFYHVS